MSVKEDDEITQTEEARMQNQLLNQYNTNYTTASKNILKR